MPWKETYVMDQRKEFVLEAMDPLCNFTRLCSKYGISTKTGYKWKSRFIQEGFAGLFDQSRRPENSPVQIPEDTMLENEIELSENIMYDKIHSLKGVKKVEIW